jgi:hypothetical protein
MKYIEGKYSAQIPVFRGEWSGLWSEAKTQSPKISALARYAHDQTPSAETLWSAISMTRQIPAPVGNFASLYDLMMTYDEHSGAGNNGWPQLNSRGPLEEQNREYVRFMTTARDEVDRLVTKGIRLLAQPSRFDKITEVSPNRFSLLVYNGLSWDRDDVVKVSPPDAGKDLVSIREAASGANVKFDVDQDGDAIFVARRVPGLGYATFDVTLAAGSAKTTFVNTNTSSAQNRNFSVKLRPDGTIESIRDLRANREIVNNNGERPFNDLLRVEGQDASAVVYPLPINISVSKGIQMSRITVRRDRSVYPLTTITIYDGLDRVDIHNELDPSYIGFVVGNKNWNDSYYFAFPFNLAKDGLKILRGGQKWFDKLPDDYLPDARHDAVTTQHLLGMTDGRNTAMIAHRQAFHWVYPGFVSTKIRPRGAPAELPAMFTGKFPLPEATIYSRALRSSSEADTHDLGVVEMDTVEPGLGGNYIYDYSISSGGMFDPVAACRFGSELNLPLNTEYVQVAPAKPSLGFFSVDQANVQIVDVKPLSDTVIRGEVSAAPLDPQTNKVFVIRLQEFAGRAANVRIGLPSKIRSASIVNLTENKVVGTVDQVSPLVVAIKPYQTLTIRIEVE